MRARDLAELFPLVLPDTDAFQAARSMAAERRPGLIVCDKGGRPYAVLPAHELLRALLPEYLRDVPLLVRVLDEGAADDLARSLPRRTLRHVVARPGYHAPLASVHPHATALEVATVMARTYSPLGAVYDGHDVIGAVTVDRLLEHLLRADGA
jgi:CBS domain-containing protein